MDENSVSRYFTKATPDESNYVAAIDQIYRSDVSYFTVEYIQPKASLLYPLLTGLRLG